MVIDYSATINRYTPLDAYPLPNISDLVNKIAQYSWFSVLDLKSAYHQVPIAENEKYFTAFEAAGDFINSNELHLVLQMLLRHFSGSLGVMI